ncbi:MAG: stage II sporulation protein M [Acidimicrobiia bacterium]
MKLPEFIETGEPRWSEIRRLLERRKKLEPDEVLELASLYRAATADLAFARRRFPTDPATVSLERLVADARSAVYAGSGRRQGVVGFFRDTYWALIFERRRALALAAFLLFVPGVAGALWAAMDPESLVGVLPGEFLWVTSAESTDQGYGAAGLVGFSTYVLTNNIRVTLIAFALGITYGIGTGWILAQNGVILGALTGLAVSAGNGRVFVAAVIAHGILEISCIIVGGASGLSLGRAILRPGSSTRRDSLGAEAVVAVQLVLGTACWLILAGFVEGFASRTGLSWVPTTVMGVALGGVFWFLVWTRGRRVSDQIRASRLALT